MQEHESKNSNSLNLEKLLEMASENRRSQISENYKRRKASARVTGYCFKPYINRVKKIGFGKLIIQHTVNGSVYETLQIKDVHSSEAAPLIGLSGRQASNEHERRVSLRRYGFSVIPDVVKKRNGRRLAGVNTV